MTVAIMISVGVVLGALALLANKFLFSIGFTNRARQQFIVDSLKGNDFAALSRDHEQEICFENRTAPAHWISHPVPRRPGVVLEFDVHPSRVPFCVSASEYIRVRDETHLEEIKRSLASSDDYSTFIAQDEDILSVVTWRGPRREENPGPTSAST